MCPQHVIQHNICQNNDSGNIWPLLHCAQQNSESAHLYPKHILHYPPAPGDPVVCNSLFPAELSSVLGFHKKFNQGEGVITQEIVVQIWPSLPSVIFFFNLLQLKICAPDEDPLDPTSTHRNLYSVSTRASSTRQKKPL